MLPAPCPERRCGWLCGAVRLVLVCCSLEAELWRGWPRPVHGACEERATAGRTAGWPERGREMDDEEFKQLLQQAYDGETEAVLAAVDLDPALATRANEDGVRLLHEACGGGHLELATGLLDRGSDVHARNDGGSDALYYASIDGHLPVATLLLDRGADPCTRDDDWTALGAAAAYGRHPVVLLLLSRGADLAATMTGLSDPVELKTALDLCGQHTFLSNEQKEQRREEMRAAFAAGPHPSQVQRRRDENWERRAAFVSVLVLSGLQPLAARREQLAAAALPHDVPIPRLPDETPAQRLGNLRAKVFAHEKIWRDVAAFL